MPTLPNSVNAQSDLDRAKNHFPASLLNVRIDIQANRIKIILYFSVTSLEVFFFTNLYRIYVSTDVRLETEENVKITVKIHQRLLSFLL